MQSERLVEEDLVDALVNLDKAFLRPRDALLDETRFLAEPLLAHARVVLDLACGHASLVFYHPGLAPSFDEDLLDFLVGIELLLTPVRLGLGLRLAENVLCLFTSERDDVLAGLLGGGEDCGDARADALIVLRGLDLRSRRFGPLPFLLRSLLHGRLGRRFLCVHHV